MPDISDNDLGFLVWCAMDYDRRLPEGRVPDRIWASLSDEWIEKIGNWKTDIDVFGAQVRPRDEGD